MNKVFLSLGLVINVFRKPWVVLAILLILLWPSQVFSQKRCQNPPTLALSETSGTTCYLTPVVVEGNHFGGSATAVTLSVDGFGTLSPYSAASSPFSFTYIPVINDVGRTVTISVSTNNPNGSPCKIARATYTLTVVSGPNAPVIENVSLPSCTSSTGSVDLGGLPSSSPWLITILPGGLTFEGSGSTATVDNLSPGSYRFTVSVLTDCISDPSDQVDIIDQPGTPPPPIPGPISAPTCLVPTGSVFLYNLPAQGTWTLTRYPGTITTTGTGTSYTVSEIPPGTYNYTVSTESGCVSTLSANITIPDPPVPPAIPVIGDVVQPTLGDPAGSVTLTGLPGAGQWTIIRLPDNLGYAGSGVSFKVTGLVPGTFTFKVRDNSGCTSGESTSVTISEPDNPTVVITDPLPVCSPATVDLTAPEIVTGSTSGLIYSFWMDNQASVALENPDKVTEGTYYIKGTSISGYFDIKPVNVTVKQPPHADAGADQVLALQFSTVLDAKLGDDETGKWSADTTKIVFGDSADPHSSVSNLKPGNNILAWIVSNTACPADTGKVTIVAGELIIPTLITPNGDSHNEYFKINGLETLGKTELTVFDRRGFKVYSNDEYDNSWNGIDFNEHPLMNDTYFFVLKSSSGRSYSGYIVVRR